MAKKVFYWPGSKTPHTQKYADAPKAAQKAHAKAHPKAQKKYVAKQKAAGTTGGAGRNSTAVNRYLAGRNSTAAPAQPSNPLIAGAARPMAGENGVVMQPRGTPKGYGVLFVNGVAQRYIKLPKTWAQALPAGKGVQIVGGKPVGFAANRNAMPTPKAVPGGPPLDPLMLQSLDTNQRNFNVGNLQLTGERARTLQSYGYTGQFDKNDALVPGSLKFDPTDPYSRAALLKQNFDRQRNTRANQMAAMGQRTSGAFLSGQNALIRNEAQGTDQLTKSLGTFLSGVATRRSDLASTKSAADIAAKIDAAGRAVPQPL
jgi:hypothetical protein